MSDPAGEDHDRGIRNEERHAANDRQWIAHEEAQRASWIAHATVHDLEERALQLQQAANEPLRALVDSRLAGLEQWKNKAAGAAVILTLASAAIGAAVAKAFGG